MPACQSTLLLSIFLHVSAITVGAQRKNVTKPHNLMGQDATRKSLKTLLNLDLTGATEWTSWFNVDHPGGEGDYETIEAVRFYYRDRLCARPIAIEARTTEWVAPEDTKEIVHSSPEKGFWCINREQKGGRTCSNYHVRFQCPLDQVYWAHWSTWSSCSQTGCGSRAIQIRQRSCINAQPLVIHNLQKCVGEATERRICNSSLCKGKVEGKWSNWGSWSTCTKTCGGGKKVRSRICISKHVPCSGSPFQAQKCGSASCEGCHQLCTTANAIRACSACTCASHILLGKVLSSYGSVLPNAKVFLKEKLLGTSDTYGQFRIPGICADGHINLTVHMDGFSSVTLQNTKNGSKLSYIEAILKRQEKPYMVQHPYSKIRRVGQKVTMCCEATGNPAPTKYYWYHNGTLLDKQTLKYNKQLILRNIHPAHSGTYQCKASNGLGTIKSSLTKLTVIGKGEASCEKLPQEHLIKLPTDCYQSKTGSFYYNAGKCPNTRCIGHLSSDLLCKDKVDYCCGVNRMELKEVKCAGYMLPIMVVSDCNCSQCVQPKVLVRGRVTTYDTGEPLRFGQILVNRENMGFTGYKGEFTIEVPIGTERFVVTFVDPQDKFVETIKVFPFDSKGSNVYQDVKVMRKSDPVNLDSTLTNILSLGSVEKEDPIGELVISPNSFTRSNGESYKGTVKASVTFLDPRNISTASAASSDLNFVSRDGDISPLRTYGMFAVDFKEEATNVPLQIGKVEVHLNAEQVKMPKHLKEMKLWSLNPKTGLWEEESNFQVARESRRKRREERTFLIGQLEIKERRLFNLDVPENRRCFVKVRAYMNDKFIPNEQLEGVVITLINLEPMPGFSSNPRAWGRFDSVITGRNGACLPAFCDAQRPDAYTAYVTAIMGGEELEAAPSSPKLNPNVIGVSQPYLSKLGYERTDHEDSAYKKTAFKVNLAKPNSNNFEETRGPIYSYRNLRGCEEAPVSDNHFRFYRVEEDKYEYNVVPFDESDLTSWIGGYLSWWPNPQEFRACYMKVRIQGPQDYMVRSRNIGGSHPRTTGHLYGLRDIRTVRDLQVESTSAACLEFKCSGMLYDQNLVDRTLVVVAPQGSCRVAEVNSLLKEYLARHPPLAIGNDTGSFSMLAPVDPLGHNYGIYTVTDQNPHLAKEIAIGRCFDGTSDGFSREMKSQMGIALTFRCQEKPVTRESFFQRLLNNPGDTLREIRQEMKESEQPPQIVPYPITSSSARRPPGNKRQSRQPLKN
ncbi:cartilage intermediate layer protein 2 [Bombina bombina]|uniref:cartilage intermediate layer protein 2 n=1 Tax=Bombina bombina TaxID=8345 RepID=UPI00235AE100|nr:cartilage intermediate layer protein 2 [Bombina bombina]